MATVCAFAAGGARFAVLDDGRLRILACETGVTVSWGPDPWAHALTDWLSCACAWNPGTWRRSTRAWRGRRARSRICWRSALTGSHAAALCCSCSCSCGPQRSVAGVGRGPGSTGVGDKANRGPHCKRAGTGFSPFLCLALTVEAPRDQWLAADRVLVVGAQGAQLWELSNQCVSQWGQGTPLLSSAVLNQAECVVGGSSVVQLKEVRVVGVVARPPSCCRCRS